MNDKPDPNENVPNRAYGGWSHHTPSVSPAQRKGEPPPPEPADEDKPKKE